MLLIKPAEVLLFYTGADRMKEEAKNKYISPYGFATLYAKLGEWNQAMVWLERAYHGRDFPLTQLQVDPTFDALRSDPRFQDLLRRMNFPP